MVLGKISDAFMEFAKPMLDRLGPNSTSAARDDRLKIAFTIWNAVVYADNVGDSSILDKLKRASSDTKFVQLINQLIERKRTLFGTDDRLVGDYKFIKKGRKIFFRVEAHDPYPKGSKKLSDTGSK